MDPVLGIGIAQCVLFLVLNIQKKQKKLPDVILFAWLTYFLVHFILVALFKQENSTLLVETLSRTFSILHGPFLFVYAYTVFKGRFPKYLFFHVLPFLLAIIFGFLIIPHHSHLWESILVTIKSITLISYPLYTVFWLNNRVHHLKTERSDNLILETSWIKLLAVILLARIGIGIIHMLLEVFFDIEFSRVLDEAIYVAQLTVMGYYGLKLGIVYEPGKNKPKTIKKSYRHSPLKAEERLVLKNEILRFFIETDDYLQPDFSLAALSEALHRPRHHLSETINSEMNSTFYDLVNTRRIEFVLQQLHDKVHEKITVEALGYDAGFNTKSAFYHHFKKHTGKTPGQYKSQISSLSS